MARITAQCCRNGTPSRTLQERVDMAVDLLDEVDAAHRLYLCMFAHGQYNQASPKHHIITCLVMVQGRTRWLLFSGGLPSEKP